MFGLVMNRFPALDPTLAAVIVGLVASAVLLGVVSVYTMLAVYAERKLSAFMQNRLGPMEVGPTPGGYDQIPIPYLGRVLRPVVEALGWVVGSLLSLILRVLTLGRVRIPWGMPPGWYGIWQSLADGLKLLAKEDMIPDGADGILFRLAPYIVFTASFTAFAVIPFAPGLASASVGIGILVYLATSSISGIGLVIAGYASNNKWSLYGAFRSLAQVVSYEVPLVTSLLCGVLVAGSLDLAVVSEIQAGGIHRWIAFHDVFLFIAAAVYFIAALAEVNRTPFDIPEAESELVSGYHTEYSGMRFSLFFLAEYANMLLVSAIAAVVFFGGYDLGIPGVRTPAPLGPLVLAAKAVFGVLIMIWLRWTLPRFRVDQLMELCWKGLIPISLVSLFGAGLTIRFPALRFAGILLLFALIYFYIKAVMASAPRPRKATS